jgi:hypothetical protein
MTRFELLQLSFWQSLPSQIREAAPLPILEHMNALERVSRLRFEAFYDEPWERFDEFLREVAAGFAKMSESFAQMTAAVEGMARSLNMIFPVNQAALLEEILSKHRWMLP